MSKLEIIPYKTFVGPKKRFLLSCSIFRMEGAYRNFDKYMNGLDKIIKESYIPDCNIVIFTDNSALKYKPFKNWIDNEIVKYDHIEVDQYFCKDFIKQGTDYHSGTFGSIARFYPFTRDQLAGFEAVYCFDIDLEPSNISQKYIEEMLEKKCIISYESFFAYKKPWIPNNVVFPIINHRFIASLNFPRKLLERYLHNLRDYKYNEYYNAIVEEDINKHKQRVLTKDDKFIYGLDELFTNDIVLNYYKSINVRSLIYLNPFIFPLQYYYMEFVSSNGMNYKEFNELYMSDIRKIPKNKLPNFLQYIKELTQNAILKNYIGKYKNVLRLSLKYMSEIKDDFFIKLIVPTKQLNNLDIDYKIKDIYDSALIIDSDKFLLKDKYLCKKVDVINVNPKIKLYEIQEPIDKSLFSEKSRLCFDLLEPVHKVDNHHFMYDKNSGLLKSHFEEIKKYPNHTSGKRLFVASIYSTIFHIHYFISPFFNTDYFKIWKYVPNSDKYNSESKLNVTYKQFLKMYISLYKNITGFSNKEFSKITIEDFVEFLCGGNERFQFIKEVFDYLLKNNIELLFISNEIAVRNCPKLFHEFFNILVPSKKYNIIFIGSDYSWNTISMLLRTKYNSLCGLSKEESEKIEIVHKIHKTEKNKKPKHIKTIKHKRK